MNKSFEFLLEFSRAHGVCVKRAESALSVHGISFPEFLVMHFLNSSPAKCMRRVELAEKVGMSASGITRMLKPMEKIKLVEKEPNPRDARVSLVRLSEAGETVYQDAAKSIEQSALGITEYFTASDLKTCIKLLRVI